MIVLQSSKRGEPEGDVQDRIRVDDRKQTKENLMEAFDWLYLAADGGHTDSTGLVGGFYQYSYGVAQDYENANKILTLATQKWNGHTIYHNGLTYKNG